MKKNACIYMWVKNLPAMKETACSAGDVDSISGSGRSPGEGNGNLLSILAWKIPWAVEPGRLYSPWGRKELDTTE